MRYVGSVNKRSKLWYRQANRPLLMGCSIGHLAVEAGTLGCFVRDRESGDVLVISNNHVLAREGMAHLGDAVLQPALADGGDESRHMVGRLARFQPLVTEGVNQVDAAVASLQEDVDHDLRTLSGLGQLVGLGDSLLDGGMEVAKIGRTTGVTRGRVTAFELDNVVVHFERGALRFDRQVEIEGSDSAPFSRAGDSGALIVDRDLRAIALLFAGTDFGGANGEGLTYAHSLVSVLDSLAVDLLF